MCSARADLLSTSSGRAQLLENQILSGAIKSKLYKKIRKKTISHTVESCLACLLRLGEELCVYLLADILLRTFINDYNKRM